MSRKINIGTKYIHKSHSICITHVANSSFNFDSCDVVELAGHSSTKSACVVAKPIDCNPLCSGAGFMNRRSSGTPT